MKYYIFNSPRKEGLKPLKVLNFEPFGIIIDQLVLKYGPIIIVSEEEYNKGFESK